MIILTNNNDIDEFLKTDAFKAFDKQCEQYRQQVYNSCIEDANENQKKIFEDWWNGGHLWKWSEERQDHEWTENYTIYSDEDRKEANSRILTACSMGCG